MFLYYLKLMVQLLMSPTNGWEDAAYDDPAGRRLLAGGFVPWLVLAALTALVPVAYGHSGGVLEMTVSVLGMFLKYFVSYFISLFAFQFFLPFLVREDVEERHISVFLMLGFGLLALVGMIKNCVPVDLPVLNFFPLYVLLIMWRGCRFLCVPQVNGFRFTMLCFFAVLLPPALLKLLFDFIVQ